MSVEDNTTRHEATRLGVHTHQAGMAKTLSSAEWTTHIAGEYSAPRRQPHTTLGSHCCCCCRHATPRHGTARRPTYRNQYQRQRPGEARRGAARGRRASDCSTIICTPHCTSLHWSSSSSSSSVVVNDGVGGAG